jgi:hypothetical protein
LKVNKKIKSSVEIDIKKFEEKEIDYNRRLDLKYIKLKNLEEMENLGFNLQDFKKNKENFT